MVASLLEGEERHRAFIGREGSGGIAYPKTFLQQEKEEGGKEVGGFVQGPLKFGIAYCGFRAPGEKYAAFYEPKIKTPILHVLGQVDVVVEETRARTLVDACEGGEGRVLVHPGGHFVPSQKPWLDGVVSFIKECMGGKVEQEKQKEVSVEDMDVPF
ncbi:MAG: hypothetical protein Q9163_004769 [Psora crenata]